LVRQLIRSSAVLLIALTSQRSLAQSTTSLLPDAAVLPSRGVRFRVLTGWTRYDQYLGNGGRRNIGSTLAIDSLGVAQLPFFAPIQTGIAEASGMSNFRLNAGTVTSPANSRILTAPLIIEYGLTSRITLGVVVPLVETRTTLVARLNPKVLGGSNANVGPNPAALGNAAALGQNLAVVKALTDNAAALQTRLTDCMATPGGDGCSALLAQQGTAQTLIQNTGTLATALQNLYGTDLNDHPGQVYVPLEVAAVEGVINQQIQNIASQLQGFLGTDVVVGKMFGAGGPGAQLDLQNLFAAIGRDTLRSTDRASIGDISVGATLNLLNSFGDSAGTSFFHPEYRLSVNGTFRIGTGEPANSNRAFDVATGYGQNGIVAGAAADLRFGNHLSGSAVASYTAQLGTIDVARVPFAANAIYPLDFPASGTYSAGNVLQLSVLPRIRLAGYFALTGQYSLVMADADRYTVDLSDDPDLSLHAPFGLASSTAQQIGFGFTYSTIVGPNRYPGSIPFEVSFSHLETLAGSGGPVYKTFRDRVELKVYLPTGRRR
jgi:hypothetical protein